MNRGFINKTSFLMVTLIALPLFYMAYAKKKEKATPIDPNDPVAKDAASMLGQGAGRRWWLARGRYRRIACLD